MHGHIQFVTLEGVGGIVDDIEMAGKTETLGVHRHETQVNTLLSVDHQGIEDVEVVERSRQGAGEGRNELIEEQADVVIQDINGLEYLLQVFIETAVIEEDIQSIPSLGCLNLTLFLGHILVILLCQGLAQRQGQNCRLVGREGVTIAHQLHLAFVHDHRVFAQPDCIHPDAGSISHQGSAGDDHRIKITGQELEVTAELRLIQIVIERLNGEGEFLVGLGHVGVRIAYAVLVLVINDMLRQFDRRIALTAVTFPATGGFDQYLLDGIGFLLHHHADGIDALTLDANEFLAVTDHRETDCLHRSGIANLELAIHIAGRSVVGSLKPHLHKRQRNGIAVDNLEGDTFYHRFLVLGIQIEGHQKIPYQADKKGQKCMS